MASQPLVLLVSFKTDVDLLSFSAYVPRYLVQRPADRIGPRYTTIEKEDSTPTTDGPRRNRLGVRYFVPVRQEPSKAFDPVHHLCCARNLEKAANREMGGKPATQQETHKSNSNCSSVCRLESRAGSGQAKYMIDSAAEVVGKTQS